MRKPTTRALAIALAVALGAIWIGPTRVRSAPPPPPSLAVLPVTVTLGESNQPENTDLRSELTQPEKASEFLRAQLARYAGYVLLGDEQVARAVASLRGREEACATPRCVIEIGKAARADLVLVTNVRRTTSTSVIVHGVLIDVGRARVVHQEMLELRGKPDEMIRAGLTSLARRMMSVKS